MTDPEEYLRRLGEIAGDDLSDGKFTLELTFDNRREAKQLISELRLRKKGIAALKREISATIADIKSHYATKTNQVGTGIGSAIIGLAIGRKWVGKSNVLERDRLRRSKNNVAGVYEDLKQMADRVSAQLDYLRDQIQASPEYQRDEDDEAEAAEIADASTNHRIYAYIGEHVKGPYTFDQLHALQDAGTIAHHTLCCYEGADEWHPYSAYLT